MKHYILEHKYIQKICDFDFNKIWVPKLGDYAVKKPGGEYFTDTGTIVSMNQGDLVFSNREDFKKSYMWIPSICDLIQICLKEEKYESKASEFLIKILKEGIAPEDCLLSFIEEKSLVEKSVVNLDFTNFKLKHSMDLSEEVSKRKTDFIKSFF